MKLPSGRRAGSSASSTTTPPPPRQGVKIVGSNLKLARVLERTNPDIVLITIPDAPREILHDALVETCTEAGVTCRFVRREIDLDPARRVRRYVG